MMSDLSRHLEGKGVAKISLCGGHQFMRRARVRSWLSFRLRHGHLRQVVLSCDVLVRFHSIR